MAAAVSGSPRRSSARIALRRALHDENENSHASDSGDFISGRAYEEKMRKLICPPRDKVSWRFVCIKAERTVPPPAEAPAGSQPILEYLVRWDGDYEDTWEPGTSFTSLHCL